MPSTSAPCLTCDFFERKLGNFFTGGRNDLLFPLKRGGGGGGDTIFVKKKLFYIYISFCTFVPVLANFQIWMLYSEDINIFIYALHLNLSYGSA